MTDHELATMLKELADGPAPPPRIDVDRARRAGGRRRRVRTTALVVGCAAVVAAGGVTAVAVFRPGPAPAPVAVVPGPVPVAPAPTDNPLVAKASFGWLPEQVRGIEYGAGGHGDYALAIGRGDLPPMIWLSVADREPAVPQGMGGRRRSRSRQRVGDRDGYWLTTDANDPLNHGDSYLRWPTPDGRWAQLHAYYLAVPDLQQVLMRVAGEVTFANRAVPLPLRIAEPAAVVPPVRRGPLAPPGHRRRPVAAGAAVLGERRARDDHRLAAGWPGGRHRRAEVHHEERAAGLRQDRPAEGRGHHGAGAAEPDHAAAARTRRSGPRT